jgi:FkbM family methyltransferase
MLWVLGLNRVTSPLWEMLRGGRAMRQSRRMREFYAPLLKKGAVVFDVGANVGTMTRVFAALGAKVVAVEPNADCARHIERSTSRESVEVLQAAIGDKNGLGILKVSDRKDKMSSLSEEWREAVAKDNRDYVGMWKREVTVPMVTLDALIARYGLPDYIKIDVEGYEEQALQGLSECPPLLSFEFNRLFLDSAMRALDNGIFEHATFNYTLVDPVQFELAEWVDRRALKKELMASGSGPGLGDIFARNHKPLLPSDL